MATIWELTDGIYSYDLRYSDPTQVEYSGQYGAIVDVPLPRPQFHTPDNAPPVLKRLVNPLRRATFTLIVKTPETSAQWDEIRNAITRLRLMVGGADSQAAQYQLTELGRRVTLDVTMDGTTGTTSIPVVYGAVNDGGAYYNAFAELNQQAITVTITLWLEPLGEGAAITLINELTNPSFTLEGATAGLAAAWAKTGAATATLDTATFLLNGKAQKVVTAAAGEGVYQTVTIGASTDAAAYAYVAVTSGTVSVYMYSGSTIASALLDSTDSNDISDRRRTGEDGQVWYRVPLTGTVDGTGVVVFNVRSSGGAATFFVDAAYLGEQAAVPGAWASCKNTLNRDDVSATNYNNISYTDIWDVPGDARTLVNWAIEGFVFSAIAGQVSDKTYSAGEIGDDVAWRDSSLFVAGATTNAAWSTVADGTRSDGEYERLTAAGGTGSGDTLYTFGTSGRVAKLTEGNWHVVVLTRSSSTGTRYEISLTAGNTTAIATNYARTKQRGVNAASQWEIIDLGVVNTANGLASEVASVAWVLTMSVSDLPNGGTCDIDGVWLMPAHNFSMGTFETGSTDLYINGVSKYVAIADNKGRKEGQVSWTMWEIPASICTRTYIVTADSTNWLHTLTRTRDTTLTIIPRSRHQLGAQ